MKHQKELHWLKAFGNPGLKKNKELKPSRKIAILFQAVQPPIINGIRKPMKPGGYSDSGADIAYNLQQQGFNIITPEINPNPLNALDWVFPDTEVGIQNALDKGANVLWVNTVLFSGHPLEQFTKGNDISIIGQIPSLVECYDDKWFANEKLKANNLTIAPSCLLTTELTSSLRSINLNDLSDHYLNKQGLDFPIVIKPVRGRGSEGVYLVKSYDDLRMKLNELLMATEVFESQVYSKYGNAFIAEKYMPGQEITVTVMPPGSYTIKGSSQKKDYWSLPVIKRFNHINGIAPYNGAVAVTMNSALLSEEEMQDPRYAQVQHQCEQAAALVSAIAPIRIDCREGDDGKFYLFDLNMKPNITGPGRPGRNDQASLTTMAASGGAVGWNYGELLSNIQEQAWPIKLIQHSHQHEDTNEQMTRLKI